MKEITLPQPLACFVVLSSCEFDGWGNPPKVGDVVEINAGKWQDDWREGFESTLAKVNERAIRRLPCGGENDWVGRVRITEVKTEKVSGDTYWDAYSVPVSG